jgi:hypothetical protein
MSSQRHHAGLLGSSQQTSYSLGGVLQASLSQPSLLASQQHGAFSSKSQGRMQVPSMSQASCAPWQGACPGAAVCRAVLFRVSAA